MHSERHFFPYSPTATPSTVHLRLLRHLLHRPTQSLHVLSTHNLCVAGVAPPEWMMLATSCQQWLNIPERLTQVKTWPIIARQTMNERPQRQPSAMLGTVLFLLGILWRSVVNNLLTSTCSGSYTSFSYTTLSNTSYNFWKVSILHHLLCLSSLPRLAWTTGAAYWTKRRVTSGVIRLLFWYANTCFA